jgi:hypothetical protein
MEHTRAEIRNTVDELRERVSETLDWRHYVNRYPGTTLTAALAVGLLVGRGLAGLGRGGEDLGDRLRYGYRGAPGETHGAAALTPAAGRPAGGEAPASGPRRAASQTWSRLGSRVESIVNRIVDEVTDAVEASLVPALSGWVRGRLDFDPAAGGRREGTVRGGERPGRAVYGGGPASPPPYPLPTPMAEPG